jgi:NADH pyrophosphatase NudC (nudix superfamily)
MLKSSLRKFCTTWLTVMEYLRHKWPRICSTCRKHFPVLSSFMTYHRVYN